MLGAEGKHSAKLLSRHSLPERIKMNHRAILQEQVEACLGLGVIGIFGSDRSRLQQLLHRLVHVPFRGFDPIRNSRSSTQKNGTPTAEIIQKAGPFGIDQRNIFIRKIDLRVAVQHGKLARKLRSCAVIAAFHAMGLDGFSQKILFLLIDQKLSCGNEFHRVQSYRQALGHGVENFHTVNLVSEQFNTEGIRASTLLTVNIDKIRHRGINVHDAASNSKLPRGIDQFSTHVSQSNEGFSQILKLNTSVSVFNAKARRDQLFGRNGIAQRGVGGGDHRIQRAVQQSEKHAKPLMLVLMGGGNIIKGQISSDVKGAPQTELIQKAIQSHTFLFLGTDQKHSTSILLLQIL